MRHDGQGSRAPVTDHGAGAAHVPAVVTVRWREGRAVLRIEGEVDLDSAETILRAVRHLVDAHVEAVTMEACGISFIDLAGWRGILDAGRTVRAAGARFELSVSEAVIRLLTLADLHTAPSTRSGFVAAFEHRRVGLGVSRPHDEVPEALAATERIR